jgi:hypothetical protein
MTTEMNDLSIYICLSKKAGYLIEQKKKKKKAKTDDCLSRFPITITCEIFHIFPICKSKISIRVLIRKNLSSIK